MSDTSYVLTALPHSVDQGAPFHVSVVVSPRLTPDGTLADFPIFETWTQRLATAEVVLTDQTGEPFTVTVLPPEDASRWTVVFPATTPVTSFLPQSFEDRDWHSFSAVRMDSLAKLVHLVSLAASPIDPPRPAESPLAVAIDRLSDQLWRNRDHPRGQRGKLEEWRLTRVLDDWMARGSGDDGSDSSTQMLLDLHRVRRFYERPESVQREYLTSPREGAVNERPRPLEPDFHQRVAMFADQPSLTRELGLVIDVQVDELARLAAATWLTAHIVLADGTDRTVPTRVSCQLDDGVFTTVPRTQDWNAGRLRLGDTGRFTVLDLDPDASGLKLERFVVSLPRLNDVAANDDPVTAAPPTLRAQGFSVSRNERVDELTTHLAEHQLRAAALASGAAPLLNTEDVNRGTRVEVWDDTVGAWRSLHLRSNVLTLDDGDTIQVDIEEGLLQGATASQTPPERVAPGTSPKTYLGETMFGWSGWSLSAPHPAMRPEYRYEGASGEGPERAEHVGDAADPTSSATNVVAKPNVLPGSLPRLRFGRSYSFRAWGVDLAGNSAPRDDVTGLAVAGLAVDAPGGARRRSGGVGARRHSGSEGATGADAVASEHHHHNHHHHQGPVARYDELVRSLRAEARRLDVLAAGTVPPADLTALTRNAMSTVGRTAPAAEIQALLAAMLDERARRGRSTTGPSPRVERVRRAVRPILDADERLLAPTAWSSEVLERLDTIGGRPALTADTVTAPRPLLRWHPVEPPTVVPRLAYGEGESLLHLVIRSGVDVTFDPEQGDSITVIDPDVYAAGVTAAHPEVTYHPTCQRHLAPPRTSQPDAELHGKFDDAIGSGDSEVHRRMLLIALREAGTFFDRSIPHLTDPQTPVTIDYLRLEHGAGADPAKLVDLDQLRPGDPLAPGQYLVADTDQLVLPYLPDPLANGVSMRFPDAGRDRPASVFPGGVEGTVADFDGEWPDVEPYRLVLAAGTVAAGSVDGNDIHLRLPPGDSVRARLSCSIKPGMLDWLGPWRLLPDDVRADPDMVQAALDGWLWALSPADEIRFVHAVPRPLEAPRPTVITVQRAQASTAAFLLGAVDVHGASTSRLDADATWEEWVDDIVQPAPQRRSFRATAFTTEVGHDEDMLILFATDQTLMLSGGPVRLHASRHELGDTKHRMVDYRFRATSRFTEYFHPSLVATPADRSVVGPKRRLSLPSAARPPKPVIHHVVPLFRWEQQPEPEQPFALRRTRCSGVRIFLDRPWFATGDGERLAVICAPSARDTALDMKVSQWGADPVWRQRGPSTRPMLLELDHLFHAAGYDDRDLAAYPVGKATTLPLVDDQGQPAVTVLAYAPQYDDARGLWFADVAVDPSSAYWPFVRLVVARYQPESLTGLHLSPTVRLDYSQIPPVRTATLSRVGERRVHLTVSGPVGHHGLVERTDEQRRAAIGASRRIVARLEHRDAAIPTDLGWTTEATAVLTLEGFDAEHWTAVWDGSLPLPAGIKFRQPGDSTAWRVTVEEFELFKADRQATSAAGAVEPRVIYADHLAL